MTTKPPVTGTMRAELRYTLGGQQCENVLHWELTTLSPQLTDVAILGAKLVNWWGTFVKPYVGANCILNSIKMTNLDNLQGFAAEYTTGLPLAGTSNATFLPNHVTLAVRLGTASRGKSTTGRMFWPQISSGNVSNNVVDGTLAAEIKDALEALLAIGFSADYKLAIVSYFAGHALRLIPLVTPVISVAVENILDSQRRRLPGRGR